MKKIRTLLIGLGNIGYGYDKNSNYIQTHYKAIRNNKNFKLIGVIDKNKKKLNKIEGCYTNLKLEKKTLKNTDLIVLSVHTDIQYKYVKKILNSGFKKNFLLEKPFVLNLRKLKEISKKNKKQKFFINYYRNYDDKLIRYLQKISKNKNLKIEVKYSKGFFHNFSHYLNLFIKIFGKIEDLQFKKKISLKNDFMANGLIRFKKLSLNFNNISSNKESSFVILKNNKKIFYYSNDGLKILNKVRNHELKINYNYMTNVYANIQKVLNKTKSNIYDIDSHKLFLENLAEFK